MSLTGRLLTGLSSRVRGVQLLVCLGLVLAVTAVLSPLWGAEGDGTPLALGFVRSDGTTGIVEFTGEEPDDGVLLQDGPLGVPPEPLGHQLVRLTNVRRVNQGLSPLKAASELMASSQFHSDWMADHDCFAHTCPGEPDWVTRIVNAGYVNYLHLAENIAAGYFSANDAVVAWMNSPGHRANMLNPDFRETGGGYAYRASSYYDRYWTMDFGTREDAQGQPVFPVVIENEAWSTDDLDVQLYVYGQDWANEMRFRNAGGSWSSWMPYTRNKSWTLSGSTSPATVYAQLRQGSTIVQSSDSIHLHLPPTVSPDYLLFLWAQGSGPTIPPQYWMEIGTVASWSASANRSWIKLSDSSGSGDATVSVYLEGFPTSVGTYTGKITVVAAGMSSEAQVTLVVTGEALERSHVPLAAQEED